MRLLQFVEGMRTEGKCAAVQPGGYEGYLIPCGPLSARLCGTAHTAAPSRHRRSVKPNIGDHELLLAIVHSRKDRDHKLAQDFGTRLRRDVARTAKQARCAPPA